MTTMMLSTEFEFFGEIAWFRYSSTFMEFSYRISRTRRCLTNDFCCIFDLFSDLFGTFIFFPTRAWWHTLFHRQRQS